MPRGFAMRAPAVFLTDPTTATHFGLHVRPDGKVAVLEVWREVSVGPGWMAALRLLPRPGRVIVGEVRLFPDERPFPGRHVGRWSAEYLGVAAPCPPGGVTGRLLRRLPLQAVLRDLPKVI